jgi:hypothetical protein
LLPNGDAGVTPSGEDDGMRRRRLLPAVFGLLVLGACSGGGAQSLGPVPTAPTTTTSSTVPVTSTVAPATSTTTPSPATTSRASTTTVAGPRLVNGVPQVTATPARTPIGGRVRVEGTGFTDAMWRAASPALWLAEKAGCNLFAEATHSINVSAAGRLTGEFTVPAAGACRMSDLGEQPVMAGSYRIVFACTACSIGELEVTTSASACEDVGFAANSDNLASDIVAVGMTCSEAETLVRKAGVLAKAVGDPSRFDEDGFTCTRVAFSDRFLPASDWSCTSGSKQVTFHRT